LLPRREADFIKPWRVMLSQNGLAKATSLPQIEEGRRDGYSVSPIQAHLA